MPIGRRSPETQPGQDSVAESYKYLGCLAELFEFRLSETFKEEVISEHAGALIGPILQGLSIHVHGGVGPQAGTFARTKSMTINQQR